MPDFTLNTFQRLLTTLKDQKYTFQTFAGYLKETAPLTIILRHDVDARKMNSLRTAQIENELGIAGTYYFRMVPESFDEEVIKQIAEMGHEIGYHYEDVSRCAAEKAQGTGHRAQGIKRDPLLGGVRGGLKGSQDLKTARPQDYGRPDPELAEKAIASFGRNLQKLRELAPVETICMHGSPLSKYDNRMLWEYYDYRDFGIIGEPYFDIDFKEVLYLTDTGRRWDGDSVNVRDKAKGSGGRALRNDPVDHFSEGARLQGRAQGEKKKETKRPGDLGTKSEEHHKPHAASRTPVFRFHLTFDIIAAAKNDKLPDKIMISVHPQRWDNRPLPWIRELFWQNVKNVGKHLLTSSLRNSATKSA
jgi:hypothetical protein